MQNDHSFKKTSKKRTHMEYDELKRLRLEMGCAPRDMCSLLGLKRRTYQGYESGNRGIPQDIAERVREAHRRDREFMAALPAKLLSRIDRDFPLGIVSFLSPEKF